MPMRCVTLSIILFIGFSGLTRPVSAQDRGPVIQEGGGETIESTLEGSGGATTEGMEGGTDALQEGGLLGDRFGQDFVGGADPSQFVGGVREPTTDSTVNRLFRAITGEDVPTGGTRETTGQPRRVPVSLKLGFAAPTPQAATALTGVYSVSFDRYLAVRPELSEVGASMDDDGVVTLTGIVADSSSQRLAANLIRLQPGVRRIQNRIEVQPLPSVNP